MRSNGHHGETWIYAEQRRGKLARVSLELLSKGAELAGKLGSGLVCVLVGSGVENLAPELLSHGADKVYVIDDPRLEHYQNQAYASVIADLVKEHRPEIFLLGATAIGEDLAPCIAATVGTGLHESELVPLLDMARQKTDQTGQRLIWYTPTQYCHFDPVQMDLGVKGCTAALYNMCVEPDGSVLPCQSYYQSLGSLLLDPWEQIWNHPLALSLRERRHLPAACKACLFEQECGGGCPLARSAGETRPPVAINPLIHEETETTR